jgi:hypothetical protein
MTAAIAYDSSVQLPEQGSYGYLADHAKVEGFEASEAERVQAQIESAINTVLPRRGFRHEKQATPDFLVGFAVATDGPVTAEELRDARGYDADSAWVLGTASKAGAAASGEAAETAYEKDSLVVDVVQSGTTHLVWRAAVVAYVNPDVPPGEGGKVALQAVELILRQFPPNPAD